MSYGPVGRTRLVAIIREISMKSVVWTPLSLANLLVSHRNLNWHVQENFQMIIR